MNTYEKNLQNDRSLRVLKLRNGKRRNSGEMKWLKGHLRCHEKLHYASPGVVQQLIYGAECRSQSSDWALLVSAGDTKYITRHQ